MEKSGTSTRVTDDNLEYVQRMLDTKVCKHTIIICQIYCFSMAINNSYSNAPYFCVIFPLPVLFIFSFVAFCILAQALWQVCKHSSQKRAASTSCRAHAHNFLCLVNYICPFKLQNSSKHFFTYIINIFNRL